MADPNELLARFEALVGALMTPDNDARRQAEQAYQGLKSQPESLVLGMLHCAHYSAQEGIRQEALILLRGLIVKTAQSPGAWNHLADPARTRVKAELLACLEGERNEKCRNYLADIISELGGLILTQGQWPDLLPFMFRWSTSEDPEQRHIALVIFWQLSHTHGDFLRPYFRTLYEVLANNLNYHSSLKVRLAALDATCTIVQVLYAPEERAALQELVPVMLNCLEAALNDADQKRARSALETFVELAELEPGFLRPNIVQITTAMFHIALANRQLEPATRQFGLEFLVTLTESKAPLVKKIPNFLATLVPLLLNMMLDIDDMPLQKWNGLDEDEDTETSDQRIASQSLDRISMALGGKTLFPMLYQHLPRMLANQAQWKERYAALISLSLIAEGSLKFLTPNLPQLLALVVPMVNDPEPRVRYAACQALGQMCTDFGPNLQTKHHAAVIPALLTLMDDVQNPRVQAHAASAIINFCDAVPASVVKPYLDNILFKLAALLQQGSKMVMEQALTAVAAVADCVEEEFTKYYDTFVPFLISVLQRAVSKEYRLMRGKAIECISLIGVSVGKQRFLPDVRVVVEELAKTQLQHTDDDPQTSFTLQAWARICKCLGSEFVPFLSAVMPPLIKSATVMPEVEVTNEDTAKQGWEILEFQGQRVAMRTATLEEKATAVNMLFCYAQELKDGFYPYVMQVANILVPLLGFDAHDGIRGSAAQTMPHLLRCIDLYNKANHISDRTALLGLWNEIFPRLLGAIQQEGDLELLEALIQPLHESIEVVGEHNTAEQLNLIVVLLKNQLIDVEHRQAERQASAEDQDYDEDEAERQETLLEHEDDVLSTSLANFLRQAEIAETVGSCAKVFGQHFLPGYVQELHTYVQRLMGARRPHERKIAICIVDDVMEFCGPQFIPVMLGLMSVYVAGIQDESAEVRQAIVYGLGVCAARMQQELHGLLPDILTRLNAMITAAESRNDENVFATENAIAAFGKLIQHHTAAMDAAMMMRTWLNYLPVKEDTEEGPITYGILCTFLENQQTQQAIFGQDWANLPKILQVIGFALGTPLVDAEVTARFVNILRGIRTAAPQQSLQAGFATLTPEVQQKLLQAQQ